jgi:[protein-PII] uridylyltransferase
MAGAADLVKARAQLLSRTSKLQRLDAAALREVLVDLHEFWLNTKAAELQIRPDSGFAIVAVGGLGRREMLPYSDLDLILLHDDADARVVSELADKLWYPLWDAHIKLDHSVRTVPQALEVAAGDMTACLGMLEARHIVGDAQLSGMLINGVRQQWRATVRGRFEELVDHAEARWRRSGEIAHRAEPDLKHGRGGLRDIQLLNALAIAQLTDAAPGLRLDTPRGGLVQAHRRLLDIRTEQHRAAGRAGDHLRAQDADDIAGALHIGDRFDLARVISDCARTISYSVEVGVRTARNAIPRRGIASLRRAPSRRPLDEGVVEHSGEVVLARDARPQRDPALVLRVAAAAAQHELPMSASTLNRLAETAPELREPWPREALHDLLVLLGSGRNCISVIEALDRTGLWGRILPEWGAVRDLPPRDAIHTWTVDRHLVETVAHANPLTTEVSRPDLLLLGALVHDIGKGRGGDHSVVGAELAVQIGNRMGLAPEDVHLLSQIVRHHLLLPQTATRRDLADPATADSIVTALDGSAVLLDLLHALAEADSHATGPGVWNEWKASLIGSLTHSARLAMAGAPLPTPDPIDPALAELVERGGVRMDLKPVHGQHIYTLTVIAPDRPGLLSKTAGVLALWSLRVHAASVGSHKESAVNTFTVSPVFGAPPDAGFLRQELMRALDGTLDLAGTLAEKEREAAERGSADGAAAPGAGISVPAQYALAPPKVLWLSVDSGEGALLEVRAEDRLGLLYRIAGVLEREGADIAWAKLATMGSSVIDTFSLRADGPLDERRRERIAAAVLAVLPEAPPPKPPNSDASGAGPTHASGAGPTHASGVVG